MGEFRHRGTAERSRLAAAGGVVLWQMVGVAAGAISYAAEAGGFELEMRRAALRSRRTVSRTAAPHSG